MNHNKVLETVLTPFKMVAKQKIFFQILIIIALLLLLVIIEAFIGIFFIGKVGTISEDIVTKRSSFAHIYEIQNYLNQLQLKYYTNVVDGSSKIKDEYGTNIRPEIDKRVDYLFKFKDAEKLSEYVAEIHEIMDLTVDGANYRELVTKIDAFNTYINELTEVANNNITGSLQDSKKYSGRAITITVFILIFGAAVASLIGYAISLFIGEPLRSMDTASKALANGDLSSNIATDGSIEVVEVVNNLNKAMEALRKLVSGINEQSSILNTASQELKTVSNETERSAAEVAKAMEELAKASTEQANQVNQVAESVTALGELVRKVSSEVKSISLESETVAQSAKLGQKCTNDVAVEINKIYTSTKEVTEVIDELNNFSEKISQFSSVIEGIAEQTTLLALNASIEAARAGEHGKGFGVVALETGKLAEQSKRAAKQIGQLIHQMKVRSGQAVISINNSMTTVETGKQMASEASVTFKNIFDRLSEILSRIDSVAQSAKQMAERNETVISAVTNIAVLSEQSMASTEEVSATAEEQSASAEQVTALAENLANISERLSDSISVFDIGEKNKNIFGRI